MKNPFLTALVAIVAAALVIYILRLLSAQPHLKKILNQTVLDFVTAGVLIYTLCLWVVGSTAVFVTTFRLY